MLHQKLNEETNMPNPQIQINYAVTLDDMIEFNKLYMRQKTLGYIMRLIIGILLAVSIVTLTAIMLTGRITEYGIIIVLAIGIMVLFVNFFIMPRLMKANVKRQLNSNESTKRSHKYIIDENGITIEGNKDKINTKWEDINKIVKNKRLWVFLLHTQSGYFLPTEKFTEQDTITLESYITENINPINIKYYR